MFYCGQRGRSVGPMDLSLRGGFYGYQQQMTSVVVREDEDEGEELKGIIHHSFPHFLKFKAFL